ncbi:MAG: NAD(+)/NADH kinase, partial [Sediminibacterium sp.]
MKIAIYSRGLDLATPSPLAILLEALAPHDVEIHVFHQLLLHADLPADTASSLIPFKVSADLDASIDCMISLGGDGTMLDAVTLVKDSGIPILGINFGRLGFLASISPDALQSAVEAIVNRT